MRAPVGVDPAGRSRRRASRSSTSRSAAIRSSFWSEASPTSCSTPSSASQASARRYGRSSTASRSRSRTRRAWSPPASSRSARSERGGGLLLPVDSEHSALYQCLEGRDPGERRSARADSLRRAVPRPDAGGARGRDRGAGARPPDVAMGPKITVDSATLANKGLELIEAHWLFGVPYERIEVVVHPTSIVHSLVRFRDGALLAHVGLPDMRVPISFALTYPSARRRRSRSSTSRGARALVRGGRRPMPSRCSAWPARPVSAAAPPRARTTPRTRSRSAAFLEGRLGFLEIAAVVEETLSRVDGAPARDLDDLVAADDEARGSPRGGCSRHDDPRRHRRARGARSSSTSSATSSSSLGLGMRPRRFYIGFPPAIWKRTRNGIEYGVGAIPLGGFVKIPGMHRPDAGDVDMRARARARARCRRSRAPPARLRGALAADDHDAARDSLA